MTYDAKINRFVLRRFEAGDWTMHANGYNETLLLAEKDLLLMLTGKVHPSSSAWFHMSESNRYRFDFDPPPPAKKSKSQRILERMDIRDVGKLRCWKCKSHNVETLEYSVSVNPGGANRYVRLAFRCIDCGYYAVDEWDD